MKNISRDEKIRRDAFWFFVSAVALAWINIVFWFYIMGFPIVNTVWENTGPNQVPISYRGHILWYIVFFILFNGLLPLALLFTLSQPNSLIRTDIHLIVSFLGLLCALLTLVGTFTVYWVWCNTSLSEAAVACNSPDYCCVYNNVPQNQDVCPSTVACNPPKTRDDIGGSNGEWRQLFWISLALVVVALIHWLINRVIRSTGLARSYTTREAKIFGIVFVLASCGLFFWYVGILSVNLNFICGYPLLEGGVELGTRTCTVYGWDYWFIWIVFLNFLPIIAFVAAMINNQTSLVGTAHQVCAIIAAVATLIAFIYFIGVLIFQTNDYVFLSPLSISNHEKYCCDKFASHPEICPNTTPCLPGTSVNLLANPNSTFLNIFIATFVFLIHTTLHLVLNNRMKRYNVFFNPNQIEE